RAPGEYTHRVRARHGAPLLRIGIVLAIVLSSTCFNTVDAHSDDVSIQEHVKRFARDGAYLAAAPLRLDLGDILPLALVGGAIGATIAYDGALHDRMAGLRHWSGTDELTTAGSVLQYGGLIGGA